MRNAEDTPADGFPRVTGPLPRRQPEDNRPDWTAPGEADALANDEALRYAARRPATGGAPWGAAPEPPRPPGNLPPSGPAATHPASAPRRAGPAPAAGRSGESGPGPAVARSGESGPRGPGPAVARSGESGPRGPGPAVARSGESGPGSLGPRPATVRSGQPMPRRPGLQPPAAPPVGVTGRAAPRDPAPPRRAGAGALAQVPYAVVLLIAAAGIWWAWSGSHDVGNGAGVVGWALLAAAIARLALPQSAVGLLASRRRLADVLALGAFGAGLLVLAFVLPPT